MKDFRNKPMIDIIIDIGTIISLVVIALMFFMPMLFPTLDINPQFLIAVVTVIVFAIRRIIRWFK